MTSVVQSFGSSTGALAAIGLLFDLVGAILVLGPDYPPLAKAFTKLERYKLQRLVDELKNGTVIFGAEGDFEDLQVAIY